MTMTRSRAAISRELCGRDDLVTGAGHEHAVLRRVHVDDAGDLVGDPERGEEADALRSCTPDRRTARPAHGAPAACRPRSAASRRASRTNASASATVAFADSSSGKRSASMAGSSGSAVSRMYWSSNPSSSPLGREARRPERSRHRPGREVGAVLVVDVPERRLAEDSPGVRHLEEQRRFGRATSASASVRRKSMDVVDVLERVPTDDERERPIDVPRLEERPVDRHPVGGRAFESCLTEARVDADALAAGRFRSSSQEEIGAPASRSRGPPCLRAGAARQASCASQSAYVLEARREGLGLLVARAVVVVGASNAVFVISPHLSQSRADRPAGRRSPPRESRSFEVWMGAVSRAAARAGARRWQDGRTRGSGDLGDLVKDSRCVEVRARKPRSCERPCRAQPRSWRALTRAIPHARARAPCIALAGE